MRKSMIEKKNDRREMVAKVFDGRRFCESVCMNEGVFLVTTANAILPVDRDHSVNTYS